MPRRSHPQSPADISRRDWLRLGALGSVALPFAKLNANPVTNGFGRAKRCVLLFLTGGPPQLDTFDPKPDAPVEVRGETKTIATAIPGVRFGELCPRLAAQANRFRIVRSVTHGDSTHTSAGYTMLTGVAHPTPNVADATKVRPNPNDNPHFGSLLAKVRPPREAIPVFASLPEVIKDAAVNEFPGQGAGFLGKKFDPFRIDANIERTAFIPPEIVLSPEMTVNRISERRRLQDQLDRQTRLAERRADWDALHEQSYRLIDSQPLIRALQMERESPRVRASYGEHLFGQGCLLARRLLEADVPLVAVYWHYEGPDDSPVWDTHENNFRHLRTRLAPPADRGIACLIEDLANRGMLSDTLVIVMGEFGRSPKVNKQAGRDHWPQVQSILLAGAGIPGGTVYGSSDKIGGHPATLPVSPADLMATFLHLLGIPPDLELHDRTGRPLPACSGARINGLIT